MPNNNKQLRKGIINKRPLHPHQLSNHTLMLNIKNTPFWVCFRCSATSSPTHMPDRKNVPSGAHFSCLASSSPCPYRRTANMCALQHPSVHFGCSASSSPPLRASTENTPPWACFLSSPSTRHIPSSPSSHEHHHPTLHDEHPNHAHVCVLGVQRLSRLSSCRQLEKCDGCVALFVLAGYAPRQQTPSPNPSPKALIPHLTSLPPFPLLFL